MLGSLAVSKTAKLVATCVCPVVGVASLTMAVPKMRDAVHKATAPRQYALPKTRTRLPETAAYTPCADTLPVAFSGGPITVTPDTLSPLRSLGDGREPIFGAPSGPPGGGGIVSTPGSLVPEPATWLQLIAGFAMIGAALRAASGVRKPDDEAALLARVADVRTDAPR